MKKKLLLFLCSDYLKQSIPNVHSPSASSLAVSWTPLCGSSWSRNTTTSCFLCWFSIFQSSQRAQCGLGAAHIPPSHGCNPKAQLALLPRRTEQTAAARATRKVIYYSKVLRAASYSAASLSARSGTCDPTVFPPEKISPDSLAAGREHAGWDVCFLQLLFVSATFPPPTFPLLLCSPLWWWFRSVWSVSTYSHSCTSLWFLLICLLLLFLAFDASAPCPAAEGCRLGLSSVSDKVGLQPAACPTSGPSPPGLVTPSSALLRLQSQHRTRAGWLQLEDQRWRVKFITFTFITKSQSGSVSKVSLVQLQDVAYTAQS